MEQLELIENKNTTILVVEDELILRELFMNLLERFNYKIITAIDGIDGLKIYNDNKDLIDLVILDFHMPNLSGKEVLEKMLKIKNDVKVIITSGGYEHDFKKGILSKAEGYLQKPFTIKKLNETVKNTLNK